MWRILLRIGDLALTIAAWGLFVVTMSLILTMDVAVAAKTPDKVRAHIRDIQFDFVNWTIAAMDVKIRQASLNDQALLDEAFRTQTVRDYVDLVRKLQRIEADIAAKYADPGIADAAAATADLRAAEDELRAQISQLQPLAEVIFQEQISAVLADVGLAVGGQPIPPVAFHFTGLPYALIVSPRHEIRQAANLDVSGDLTLDELVALEERVAGALDMSTLVAPLGGIGTYPTMVGHSSDLNWLAAVGAHEWLHNYLTLRPLGYNYDTTPELRTMNETTASLAGNEIGALVIARYYPDLQRPPEPFKNVLRREQPAPAEQAAPAFDFRAEMRTTRVHVDELLAQGQVAEAEAYMEARRRFLWDHGYQIRKLNQAYFAFHGAYADVPGAPGADPVGPAVQLLRRRSPSLAYFVNTMAQFTGFGQLQNFLGLAP